MSTRLPLPPSCSCTARWIILALLLVLCSNACSSSEGAVSILDPAKTNQIFVGKTTKNQVRSILGEPEEVLLTSPSNENWLYTTTRARTSGLAFIPLLPLFTGVSEQQENTLTIEFGPNGVVRRTGKGSLLVTDRGLFDR